MSQTLKLTGRTEEGPAIQQFADWFREAPPARGAEQWKDYRSAKELARAWCRYGPPRCPEELTRLFPLPIQ